VGFDSWSAPAGSPSSRETDRTEEWSVCVAFKKTSAPSAVPDSPEKLLRELPRRKITDVLLHQGEVMRTYAQSCAQEPDVALQLPTGSGKTLVGLMIAEWRRRKNGERIVYV
jgi:superfamily II DNA or RNA helicase